jgi:hypothetical protein
MPQGCLVDGFGPNRRASRASLACRSAAALLLAVLAAGCSETTSSNASLTTGAAATSGPTLAFDSIDGPPVGTFNRLVDNLTSEAQARQLSIASREGAANYRVRGYLAAQVVRGRTLISWVWDVYDDDKFRILRISGEEAGGRGGDPWAVADEAMLRKIARVSMDRIAGYLRNPAAPVEPDAPTAIADAPEPAAPVRSKPRRPARAEAPSAAEKLAMAASR